eukprot:6483275-Amphidinium_carterae.2
MDDCTKSVTVLPLNDIQDKYTQDEVRKYNTRYPIAVQEGEEDYDEYMNMTVNIKKMRGDIAAFVTHPDDPCSRDGYLYKFSPLQVPKRLDAQFPCALESRCGIMNFIFCEVSYPTQCQLPVLAIHERV